LSCFLVRGENEFEDGKENPEADRAVNDHGKEIRQEGAQVVRHIGNILLSIWYKIQGEKHVLSVKSLIPFCEFFHHFKIKEHSLPHNEFLSNFIFPFRVFR
jgi:hypothetical protein